MGSLKGFSFADSEDNNANSILENSNSNSSNSLFVAGESIGTVCNASQQGDLNSVITIDSNDDGKVSENEINWAELPSLAVEKIYSFLCRTDQSCMSQVCSHWSKEFSSACLWKTMKFHLPEHNYFSDICPEVKFARKYALMFQDVEIICRIIRAHLIKFIWNQLKLFLQEMASSSQLFSIKFINMGNYFCQLDGNMRKDLLKTIISFFNSQENLKTVVFQESRFSKEDGLKLLKAILHSDSSIVKTLTLRGFVKEYSFAVISSQYIPNLSEVCERIAKVQSLEIDYTQFFEDVIFHLFEKLSSGDYQLDETRPLLSTLNIYCEGKRQLELLGIPPETWLCLSNLFSDLKVKMDVTIDTHLESEMKLFLVRDIPLQSLDFRLSTSLEIDINALLTHLQICKYQDHLEVLNIFWLDYIGDFGGSVIPFMLCCLKLRDFHLEANYTLTGYQNVLKSFLETANFPGPLQSFQGIFRCQNQELESFNALLEAYSPLLQAKLNASRIQ